MESFVPLVAALALVWKVVDWLKQVRTGDWNAAFTQAAVWAAGVGTIVLLAHTDFSGGVMVAHHSLAALNGWSLVLIGLSVGSSGSVAYDFKRAFDNSDSAAQPSLLPQAKAGP